MRAKLPLLCVFIVGLPFVAFADDARLVVSNFAEEGLKGWKTRVFDSKTTYAVKSGVLHASCDDSASAVYREFDIDLEKTPYLQWSWKVEGVYESIDERTRAGDDYPARIYVIKKKGLFGMGTLALNYVWSNQQKAGTTWESAYTDQAQMVAVDAGTEKVGQWRTHRRNVARDFRALFGEDVTRVDGVAVMTDCDDSGQSMKAAYKNIAFVSVK